MAPDLFSGHDASVSDLYVVGLIAYQRFIGRYPFNHKVSASKLLTSILVELINFTPIDEEIWAIIKRLLARDPCDRYHSADDVIKAIGHATQHLYPVNSIIWESYLRLAVFVGREQELAVLWNGIQSVLQCSVELYLVGGESGVGKSRLVDKLRPYALVTGLQVAQEQGNEDSTFYSHLWRSNTAFHSTSSPDFLHTLFRGCSLNFIYFILYAIHEMTILPLCRHSCLLSFAQNLGK